MYDSAAHPAVVVDTGGLRLDGSITATVHTVDLPDDGINGADSVAALSINGRFVYYFFKDEHNSSISEFIYYHAHPVLADGALAVHSSICDERHGRLPAHAARAANAPAPAALQRAAWREHHFHHDGGMHKDQPPRRATPPPPPSNPPPNPPPSPPPAGRRPSPPPSPAAVRRLLARRRLHRRSRLGRCSRSTPGIEMPAALDTDVHAAAGVAGDASPPNVTQPFSKNVGRDSGWGFELTIFEDT